MPSLDPLLINERPVGAVEVLNHDVLMKGRDLSVLTRDHVLLNDNVEVGPSAHDKLGVLRELIEVPPHLSFDDSKRVCV
jgi:hypothetical protein